LQRNFRRDFILKFKNFLDYYKDHGKTISDLSKSSENPPRSVVKSDKKLFSGDTIKKSIVKWINKNNPNKISMFSSVDGIGYFYENDTLKLIFVEFKHISNSNLKDLQKNIKRYKGELKLKSLETLVCIIPHLIDRYCTNNNCTEKELFSLYLNCPIAYICVFEDSSPNNLFSNHLKENNDIFDIERLSKHPFDYVKTMSPIEFKKYISLKFNS